MGIRIPATGCHCVRKCVEKGAQSIGVSEATFAVAMTYFLEELAAQVSVGRTVNVPGFGMFAAYTPKRQREKEIPVKVPAFSASRGFKREVMEQCLHNPTSQAELERHMKHHYPAARPDRKGVRVFTAQRQIRREIIADAAKRGEDVVDLTTHP